MDYITLSRVMGIAGAGKTSVSFILLTISGTVMTDDPHLLQFINHLVPQGSEINHTLSAQGTYFVEYCTQFAGKDLTSFMRNALVIAYAVTLLRAKKTPLCSI